MTVYVRYPSWDTRGSQEVGQRLASTAVPAALAAAVMVAGFITGCGSPPQNQASTSSTPAAASTGQQSPSGQGQYKQAATIPVAKSPVGVAVDPGTNTVYVSNLVNDNEAGTVSVIEGATRTVTATVPVGKNPGEVAVDPGTHTVYVTNFRDDTVSVIDTETKTVTATVPVGKGPQTVAVDPGTHTTYVGSTDPNSGAGTVSVIDGSKRTVTATVPVGKFPNGLTVDPDTHTVYVTNSGDDTMSVIDGSRSTVSATVPVGEWPDAVAVDGRTRTVYVATRDPAVSPNDTQPPSRSGRISVLDGSTHAVTATIQIGKEPDGVAVDPGTHTIYVTKYAGDTIAVIDGSTRAVIATVPVDSSLGHGIAVNPVTHTVYVTSFNANTISVIERQQ